MSLRVTYRVVENLSPVVALCEAGLDLHGAVGVHQVVIEVDLLRPRSRRHLARDVHICLVHVTDESVRAINCWRICDTDTRHIVTSLFVTVLGPHFFNSILVKSS